MKDEKLKVKNDTVRDMIKNTPDRFALIDYPDSKVMEIECPKCKYRYTLYIPIKKPIFINTKGEEYK
jgi:hypothetical protein